MRVVRGVGALLALLAVTVGVPVALTALGGDVLPDRWSVSGLAAALLRPDDGRVLIGLITVAGWVAWAVFVVSLLAELVGLLSRQRIRIPLPGLAAPRRVAAGLLLLVVAMVLVPHPNTAPSAPTTGPTPFPRTSATAPASSSARSNQPTSAPGGPSQEDAGRQGSAVRRSPTAEPSVVHVVRPGDDLWSLAEHYYGEGRDWRRIAGANPGLLTGGPDRLTVGWRLTVPGVAPSSGAEHRVSDGDTLSGLAERVYGSASAWPGLWHANREVVEDPDLIEVGAVLRLPDRIEVDGTVYRREHVAATTPERVPTGPRPATERAPESHATRSAPDARPSAAPRASAAPAAPTTGPTAPATSVGPASTSPTPTSPAPTTRGSVPTPATSSAAPPSTADPSSGRAAPASTRPDPDATAPSRPQRTATEAPSTGAATAEPRASASTPAVTPSATGPATSGPTAAPGTASPGTAAEETEASSLAPSELVDRLPVVAGVGGLLAAGLLAGLAARRRLQLHTRPVGRRIAQPAAPAQLLEARLGRTQDPLGVDLLDLALRAVARHALDSGQPLPAVLAAVVTDDHVELRLALGSGDEPVVVPDGFVAEGERWILDRVGAGALRRTPGLTRTPQPYPAMVGLGADDAGAAVVLNLEAVGLLALVPPAPPTAARRAVEGSGSPAERNHDVLAAMLVDLAFSRWADDLVVTVVGGDPALVEAIDHPAVSHATDLNRLLDRWEERAAGQRTPPAGLEGGSPDDVGPVPERRLRPEQADPWLPEIALVADRPTPEQRARLERLLLTEPPVAMAAVVVGPADTVWRLELDATEDGSARLEPLGLRVAPQHLSGEVATAVQDLVATTGRVDTVPAPWWAPDDEVVARRLALPEDDSVLSSPANAEETAVRTEDRTTDGRPWSLADALDPPASAGAGVPTTRSDPGRLDWRSLFAPEDPFADPAVEADPDVATGLAPRDTADEPAPTPDPPTALRSNTAGRPRRAWPSSPLPLRTSDPVEAGVLDDAAAPSGGDPSDRSGGPREESTIVAEPPDRPAHARRADQTPTDARPSEATDIPGTDPVADPVADPDTAGDPARRARRPRRASAAAVGRNVVTVPWTNDSRDDEPNDADSEEPGPEDAGPEDGDSRAAGADSAPRAPRPGREELSAVRVTETGRGEQHPVVNLLGPIELRGAAGPRPTRAVKQCIEYCAWLLEHPGSSAQAMANALAVAEGTRRSNVSRLRTWLGEDEDGHGYLPDAYSGRIQLAPTVTSDWHRLQMLTHAGVNLTGTDGLVAALGLVRGAPLADAAPGQWHWAEELRTDMVSVVRDIAVELADRALASGDLDRARWAAGRGLTAAPRDERLMAARIRTEHRAGNVAEVERLSLEVSSHARWLGLDLDPETVDLLQRVLEGRLRARS
ncbi:LysM repeat protein [Friedmanniella endophytica]|uniref:LysM repeat protein n=1 Tax=Microlunatus kandeliicorticis TaxID=1759536 RepID=A0A7W3IQX9_9ACTN|nr:LysM peptidoglycan-binding domain-containing protein [Microlunatus kandeliicorticis]MBA8793592.1 LysM repeat protein [Microlunatus kandeliicorticis]